jgi:hypothetical protein
MWSVQLLKGCAHPSLAHPVPQLLLVVVAVRDAVAPQGVGSTPTHPCCGALPLLLLVVLLPGAVVLLALLLLLLVVAAAAVVVEAPL